MNHRATAHHTIELSPCIVNTSEYMAFLFHFVVKGKFNNFHALPKRSASVRSWHELHNAIHRIVLNSIAGVIINRRSITCKSVRHIFYISVAETNIPNTLSSVVWQYSQL